MPSRDAVFVSHGNPEDNEFAGWLAARLQAAGYKIWIDLWHDKGRPTWEEIEEEIRTNSEKVIALVSKLGAVKPGFRDEINAASGVSRELDDKGFILPVRIDDISFRTEVPIQIGRLNFIDGHERGWDSILADVLAQLEKDAIHRSSTPSTALFETWLARRRAASELVSSNPERVLTNWFKVESLPKKINFYTSDSLHTAWNAAARNFKFPNKYQQGVLCTFADPDAARMSLPLGVRIKRIGQVKTNNFIAGDPSSPLFCEHVDAVRVMVDIVRQGFSCLATERGFQAYQLANRVSWYPRLSTVGDRRLKFEVDGFSGSRQLLGRHKEFYWHYAVSIDLAWTPPLRITASGHVLFSLDGEKIISDAKIAARLRRKAARSKRNAWWRDVMLSYFAMLSDGEECLLLPTGGSANILVRSTPIHFTSPVKLEFDSDFIGSSEDPMGPDDEDELDEDDLTEGEDADDGS
jgi:TIR domain